MTAVSAIVFFLGLLFGFQRPSRLLPPRLPATLHPVQPGGRILYFESALLSSDRCRSVPPFRLVRNQHRAVALCFLLRGGAEPTAFPPSLSTGFVDPFLSARSASSPSRLLRFGGGGFYHHRVGCQLRALTSYFVFHFARPELPSPMRRRLSVRGGAASIASPGRSQPPSPTRSSRWRNSTSFPFGPRASCPYGWPAR